MLLTGGVAARLSGQARWALSALTPGWLLALCGLEGFRWL